MAVFGKAMDKEGGCCGMKELSGSWVSVFSQECCGFFEWGMMYTVHLKLSPQFPATPEALQQRNWKKDSSHKYL